MKLFLSFLISFCFVFFASSLDRSGVGNGSIKRDKKTAVNIARFVAPQKAVQKQLHPGSQGLKLTDLTAAVLINRYFYLSEYNYQEISNYVSSGAKLSQNLASI